MEMRCSFCKEDRTNKEVLCTTSVSNSPVYLLISLMKFPQYNMSKIHSVVLPDQTLILQNGDHFELQGIADFHGEFVSSEHYTASVQCSKGWVTCDDSIVTPTDNIVNRNNYILLYCKITDKSNTFNPLSRKRVYSSQINNIMQDFNDMAINKKSARFQQKNSRVSEVSKSKENNSSVFVQPHQAQANIVKN